MDHEIYIILGSPYGVVDELSVVHSVTFRKGRFSGDHRVDKRRFTALSIAQDNQLLSL